MAHLPYLPTLTRLRIIETIFELRRENQTLTLKICDYGKGFDIKTLPLELDRYPGLTNMKEYTELSGGRFSLRSSQTMGTCIKVAWDVANQRKD